MLSILRLRKSFFTLIFISCFVHVSFCQDSLSYEEQKYLNRCDSLLVDHFTSLDQFTFDTIDLNYYNYSKDSIPKFSDDVIMARINEMDKTSPFDFLGNDVSLAMTKLYIRKRYRLTSRMLGLGQLYFPLFEEKLSAYHLPVELKYLPIVESALKPYAMSRSGAGGLWQFMPATGKGYGLEISSYIDERNDPYLATEAACKYLSKLFAIYGDWSLSLAAYNAGQGTVTKAIRRAGGVRDYWTVRSFLPKETQNYVPAFIAVNYIMTYASEHNIYPQPPHFAHYEMDTIHVVNRVDLQVVGHWLGYNVGLLKYLNPQYLIDVIPANSVEKMPVKMPIEFLGDFIAYEDSIYKYSSLDYKYWVAANQSTRKEVIHIIKKGETLEGLAEEYQCSVQDIKAWNIRTKIKLRSGKKLVMFKPTKPSQKYEEAIVNSNKSEEQKDKIKTDPIDGYAFHVIKKGDSLWKISQKYGCSVEQLKQLNKAIDLSLLHAGTKLKVPVK